LPGGSTTTTTLTGNPGDGSTSIAPISGTPTTRPNSGATTTTIGSGSGLPPSVDKKLDDDDGLVDGDDKVDAGRPLRVVRCGFAVGEAVDVYVAGNKIKSLSADDKGCISTTVTTPDAPGKTVTIAVYAPGSKRGAKTTIAVSGQLTATGSNLDGPLALAFLLLVVGALIAALPRRRRA
jgi:hypothetical protein